MKKHFALHRKILDYILPANIYDVGTEFQVPMYFVSGEFDKTCDAGLVQEYCERIKAPAKKLIILEGHGHSPQIVEPVEVAEVMKGLLDCQNKM